MAYKTKNSAQLRTKSGGKGGTTGVGDVIELSGKTIYWEDKEGTWNEISSSNYFEKYIQMKDLEEYTPPVEPPPNGITKTHTIEVMSDGSLVIDGIPYQGN